MSLKDNTKVNMRLNDDKDGIHPNGIRRNCEVNNIPNELPDGMHQSASVTKAPRNYPMSHLAGCTNRHPS